LTGILCSGRLAVATVAKEGFMGFEMFSRVFEENLYKRSRTAKGISNTATSSGKRKLLKEGEELKAQVQKNTVDLVRLVWDSARMMPKNADELRAIMEEWYDCIHRDLQDPAAYAVEQQKLEAIAALRRRDTGRNWRINPRYRVWTVSYTNLKFEPLELELAMDDFYRLCLEKLQAARAGRMAQAELLAFADRMLDGEIHPWADGCGRHATASLMYLSLLSLDFKFPTFGSREEHYASIQDREAHTEYFRRCLTT
jgi:hypothetical protein